MIRRKAKCGEGRREAERNTRQQWIAEWLTLALGWPGFTHCCWPPSSTHSRLRTPVRYGTVHHQITKRAEKSIFFLPPSQHMSSEHFVAGSERWAVLFGWGCRLYFLLCIWCNSSGDLQTKEEICDLCLLELENVKCYTQSLQTPNRPAQADAYFGTWEIISFSIHLFPLKTLLLLASLMFPAAP